MFNKINELVFRQSLYKVALGADHILTLGAQQNLGHAYLDRGKLQDAAKMFEGTLDGLKHNQKKRRWMEKDHLVLALTYDSLADLYVKQELFDEAKKHYKKTRKIIMRRFPGEHEDHPLWAGLIQDSAVVLEKRGKYEEAAEGFVKARELFKLKFGPKHVNYGTVTSNLARVYGRLGRLEEAETLYLEAIEIAEESGDRSKVAYRNQALGKIYQKQGRLEDACRRLERARDIYIEIKKLGEKDPKTLAVEKLLAELESKPTP